MTLHGMLTMQKDLQESVYGYDFDAMTDKERIEFITWNILALTDELHEALSEIGWKPWATSHHINHDAFKGELIDAFHFFMNLCIAVGMDATEFQDRYSAKREVNIKRQADGYDGVSTKCPVCHRALDDEGVMCHRSAEYPKYWVCDMYGAVQL